MRFTMGSHSKLLVAFLPTLSLMAGGVFAQDKKSNPKEMGNGDVAKEVNVYSSAREIVIGKELAQEVERQAKVIDDSIVAEYVNRVGQNLVRYSDAKVPITIKLLDSEEADAFALPGGFLFVNVGLILQADSESELAGVMAHEIAHVAAVHGTKQADFLGLQYLYKAGYAPTSITVARNEIRRIVVAKTGYIVNTSEFGVVKARVAMLRERRTVDAYHEQQW